MALPFEVTHDLPGWSLFWALLESRTDDGQALAELRRETAERARRRYRSETLATEPAVAELRRLFRAAGTDPTRYRPSSEALIRRLLKGGELPGIHPLVDLNNCLSVELPAPACVMDARRVAPPFELRAGREDEHYESLKGPFRLGGRPLLVDARGPCDAPITGSARVKVGPETDRAWLVAYLPAESLDGERAEELLAELLRRAPVAEAVEVGTSTD